MEFLSENPHKLRAGACSYGKLNLTEYSLAELSTSVRSALRLPTSPLHGYSVRILTLKEYLCTTPVHWIAWDPSCAKFQDVLFEQVSILKWSCIPQTIIVGTASFAERIF